MSSCIYAAIAGFPISISRSMGVSINCLTVFLCASRQAQMVILSES